MEFSIREKIRINGVLEYGCYCREGFKGNQFNATIDSIDCSKIRKDFKEIDLLEIVNESGVVTESSTSFETISEVKLILDFFQRNDGEFTDAVEIVLKPMDVKKKLQKLEDKVDPQVNTEAMPLEEYKAYRIKDLGLECKNSIFKGCDIIIGDKTMHFSYTAEDQSNLKALFDTACATKMAVPYHADKNQCQVFSFTDIIKIYTTLQSNLLYHTTYCNSLNTLVLKQSTKDGAAKIVYGQELTDNIKQGFDEALNQGRAVMDAILRTVLPEETPNEQTIA